MSTLTAIEQQLINLIPTALAATTTWEEGTTETGTFEITDVALGPLSTGSRIQLEQALIKASHAAGYVIEWRREHDRSALVFTWRRLPWAKAKR